MDPRPDPGFDPLQQQFRETMKAAMETLMEAMPGVGLALFVFDGNAAAPRANYLSNTDRRQTVAAIEEWLTRQRTTLPPDVPR